MKLTIIVVVHKETQRTKAVEKILKLEGENVAEFSKYRITSKDLRRKYRIVNGEHEIFLENLRGDVLIGELEN